MPTEGTKRKLVAILSADAKGYSRLMGEDEKATVETIKTYREVMGDLIRQHSGRVVDSLNFVKSKSCTKTPFLTPELG